MSDSTHSLTEQIRAIRADKGCVRLVGSASKQHLYPTSSLPTLTVDDACVGVLDYQPSELVITAGAGTPLLEIEALLAEHSQQLAFEPPRFNGAGTFGGMISAGLSGPSRPVSGAVRDAVLGVELIDGRAEQMSIGGQVMKNVAGYDVSRLVTGSGGALGLITSASLRVQPAPEIYLTLQFEKTLNDALQMCTSLRRQYLPINACWWQEDTFSLRLAGEWSAVEATHSRLGGEVLQSADEFWEQIRDQSAPFFHSTSSDTQMVLCCAMLPPAAQLELPGEVAMEWLGAVRWCWTNNPEKVRSAAAAARGWSKVVGQKTRVDPVVLRYMQALKFAFDPDNIFDSPSLDIPFGDGNQVSAT